MLSKRIPLIYSATLAVALQLWAPWHLTYLAPLVILSYYRLDLIGSLWISLGCGLLMDLMTDGPFGLFALSYCIATYLLYRRRLNFAEKSMGILVALFAFLVALVLAFSRHLWSWPWFFTEVMMCIFDGIYTFLFHTLAHIGIRRLQLTWLQIRR